MVEVSKHSLFSWRRHSQDHGRLPDKCISKRSQNSQDHGRLPAVHISKHSRWNSEDHGRLSGVWCGVCGVVCWCVVVVRVCGVWWSLAHSLSLSLLFSLLPLLFPFLSLSLIFLFLSSFSFSFSLAPSLTLALALSDDCCHLLFRHCLGKCKHGGKQSINQKCLKMSSRHGLWLRRWRLMSFNSPNLGSCSMKTSLANDFAVVRPETKEGPFYYRNISGEEFIFYYSFK